MLWAIQATRHLEAGGPLGEHARQEADGVSMMDDMAGNARGGRLDKAPSGTLLHDNRLSTADLRWLLGVLLRHLKLVFALPLTAASMAYGVLHFVKPLYG